MTTCHTTLQAQPDVKLNDALVQAARDADQKARRVFPHLSLVTDIDGISIADGMVSYDVFSTGHIVAKIGGFVLLKDKDTDQLYPNWQRTIVGRNQL
jgi:hypothetical protein